MASIEKGTVTIRAMPTVAHVTLHSEEELE
jgi:hypothetical protein